MKRPKIVVVGSTNTDMVFRSNRFPEAGESLPGATFAMVAGGKGANQAVAAARLGADVAFVASVGADSLGELAVAGFTSEGIDTQYIVVSDSTASGVAAILVDEASGQNRIIVAVGANARLSAKDVRAASAAISAADIVVCQLETSMEAVCETLDICRRSGVPFVLNPAPACPLPEGLLKSVTYVIPNEIEVRQLAFGFESTEVGLPEVAAERLRRSGAETVIVTLGGDGVYATSPAGEIRIPAQHVEHVVDTTAAGDCFTGALAVALAEGKSLWDAVSFANRAAAISVTRAGAQPSLPSRAEVEERRT